MYAGRVACCLMVSHGEYADGTDKWTDGRTPYRYITLSARRGKRNNKSSDIIQSYCIDTGIVDTCSRRLGWIGLGWFDSGLR